MLNALYNVKRKRGTAFKQLWVKRLKADKELIKENFDVIKRVEAKEKNWVEMIYKANGLKPPKRGNLKK